MRPRAMLQAHYIGVLGVSGSHNIIICPVLALCVAHHAYIRKSSVHSGGGGRLVGRGYVVRHRGQRTDASSSEFNQPPLPATTIRGDIL